MPPWRLRLKAWRIKNQGKIKCLLICAVAAWILVSSLLGTYSAVKGRATDDRIKKIEEQNKKIERMLNEEQRRRKETKKKFTDYCAGTQGPAVCRAVADAGVAVEETIQFPGLAKWAVSLCRSEQNYHPPPGSHNCFGIGAYDAYHFARFNSWEAAINHLAELLKDQGYRSVSPADFHAISFWYKGKPPYTPWVAMLKEFWRMIG